MCVICILYISPSLLYHVCIRTCDEIMPGLHCPTYFLGPVGALYALLRMCEPWTAQQSVLNCTKTHFICAFLSHTVVLASAESKAGAGFICQDYLIFSPICILT